MIRLYFTGATVYLANQSDPRLSLGQYISSSPIPNGSLNGVFSGISTNAIINHQRELRGLVLKNETGVIISGAELWYDFISENPITTYKMALVTVGSSACGDLYMERVRSTDALPISATFIDNRGQSNSLALPDMPINGYLGLWIVREINTFSAAKSNTCETLINTFLKQNIPQVQTITTLPDIALSLQSKYFLLNTPRSKFVFWYNVDSAGVAPSIADRETIRINISQNDTADTVALATLNQLQFMLEPRGECTATLVGSVITVTNLESGEVAPIDGSNCGFTQQTITLGSSNQVEHTEEITLSISY